MQSGKLVQTGAAKPADEQARIRAAVQRARAGDVDGARHMFEEICTANNDCEAGWLWLASLVTDAETGLDCLREVLRINPNNRTALVWLAKAQAPAPEAKPVLKCPLCRTTWAAESTECHSCHALFDLTDPAAIAANDGVNREVMVSAIGRFSSTLHSRSFESEYYTAVAHANLLHSAEAIKFLGFATLTNPSDPRLANGEVLRRYRDRPHVLVVDDSATAREVACQLVEKAGYLALQAASGADALALLETTAVSLVLMDVAMPSMDGYQVCRAIRGMPKTKTTPVVLLSAKDGLFDKAKGRMAGANEFMAKPYKPEELVRVVKRQTEVAG